MSVGRPAGNRRLTTQLKVSDETIQLIYKNKKPPETHDETILRALRYYEDKRIQNR